MINWNAILAPGTQSAQTLTDWSINHDNELRVVHPGSGVQAIVTVYDGTGTSVAKAIVAAENPTASVRFKSANASLSIKVETPDSARLSSTGLNVGVYGSSLNPVFASSDASGQFAVLPMKTSIRPRMKGFKKFFARLAAYTNDNVNGVTFQDVFTVEQDFDAIQLVIGTIQTSGTTVRSAYYVNVCADESLSDASMDALTNWQFVNWTENDGNSVHAQFATYAAGTSQPRYLISQKLNVNSIARTDGKSLPLLIVRSHMYPVNATPTVCGNGSSDVFTNVARTDGRTHKTKVATGQKMATFSGGANASQTPLFGVIYYSRGRVVNIAKFGDSIAQDRNSPMGDGWCFDEVVNRSNKNGIAYEVADFAWSGLTSANYHNIAIDAVGQFPIDIAYYPASTPNDIASGASLATATTTLNTARSRHQEFVSKCADNGVVPIIATFAPVTTAVNDYTLCDSARVAFNAEIRALKTRGVLVCDTDAALAGATVGGQVQPISGGMLDGIHPNTVGREIIRSQQFAPALSAISISI